MGDRSTTRKDDQAPTSGGARERIAIVTTSWPRFEGDPSGHFVASDARTLTRRSDVTVIAPDGDAFGWPGFAARVQERPTRLVGAAHWVVQARRELSRRAFDRVVAHWAVPCAWPIGVAATGAALEVVSHGGDVRLLARSPATIRAWIVRQVAGRAREWRFVSRGLLESLLETLAPREARAVERIARVAPSVIDVARPTEDAIAAKRAEMGGPFVVCVGRLVASKRVERAIAWAARQKVTLVIVGDGPEQGRLEEVARLSHGQVKLIGRVERAEAIAWIAAAEALVQASEAEGASTVEREAEALGTPVVRIDRAP